MARSRTLALTLAVSVAGHAVLLWWLRPQPSELRGPASLGAGSQLIELDFSGLAEPSEPAPSGAPTATREPASGARAASGARDRRGPAVAALPGAVSVPSVAAPAGRLSAPLPTDAPVGDASLGAVPSGGPVLLPRPGVLGAAPGEVLSGLSASEASSGRTVVNGPGEEGDARALREYDAERASRSVQGQLEQEIAAARRTSGMLAPYFARLQEQMRQGSLDAASGFDSGPSARGMAAGAFEALRQGASDYGRTGQILDRASAERSLNDSAPGKLAASGGGQLVDLGLLKGLGAIAAGEKLAGAMKRARRLVTVLELTQDAQGAMSSAVVLERSGNAAFDELVLHRARKVVRELGEVAPEDGGLGSSYPEGWRGIWRFTWEPPEVRVELLRVLRGLGPGPRLVAPD